MTYDNTADGIHRVAELVKEMPIAMLVTLDMNGRPRSRPITTVDAPFDGTVWFMTSAHSAKLADISANPRVNVSYSSTSAESYLSIGGLADIIYDRERIHQFWRPRLRSWFESTEDPAIRLIRVQVDEADYWDGPGSHVAPLIATVKDTPPRAVRVTSGEYDIVPRRRGGLLGLLWPKRPALDLDGEGHFHG